MIGSAVEASKIPRNRQARRILSLAGTSAPMSVTVSEKLCAEGPDAVSAAITKAMKDAKAVHWMAPDGRTDRGVAGVEGEGIHDSSGSSESC